MSAVLYERHDAVAVITLNRPDQRNAVDDTLAQGLMSALQRARDDEEVRAIVLTGAGKGFCAGADLADLAHVDRPGFVRDYIVAVYRPLIGLLTSIEKPIIAAINGYAAGAGCSIALACDLRVMAEDAAMLQAFSNIGLVPDAGATWLLARQVGYSRAYELAIEGLPLPAARCLELGLTNRIVPASDLQQDALEWATRLAARPTIALGLTKRLVHRAMQLSLDEMIEQEAALQAVAFDTHDHREGVLAFQERRKPDFQGR